MVKNQTRKEETRRNMLDAASRNFREKGFAGVGVDGIAKAANATSGAFYAHFGSKDGAFRAALDLGLDEVIDGIPRFQRDFGDGWTDAFIEYYLGRAHRDDLACGCAMTSLSPEISRADDETRALYDRKMQTIAGLVARGLPQFPDAQRLEKAWAFLGVLIGGLTIARALKDDAAIDAVSNAIKSTAQGILIP
ncbi:MULTISPECIES: TetR/AcrR family transcriptional regulator [Thalassospira]|uniref:TetR family transcriptional regulator n=2 Tax=Thalassospira TaxID=168934 RepID=A0A367VYG1_9PROT|nr:MULTISPECIES: TetR/AcrR family transcriptional regulator [Thalassospira]MDG4721536.1 TetR/AcrR family transcriptional regulator [Thalassospira sp. FZY0004]RCK31037.1 TetR family transcriptional regulator [Thalassospira profundimaris]